MFPLLTAADAPARPGPQAGGGASGAPAPLSKVELDLEGAPFLEPDEPVQQARAVEPAPVESAPPQKKSRKKLIIIAVLALLLTGGAAGAYFLLFAGDKPEPEPETAKEVVVVRGPDWGQGETSEFMIEMPAFWVELTDPEGEARFLIAQFVIPTNSDRNLLEINAKMTIIRDAVYYYLRNKSYSFLTDSSRQAEIKKDVAGIISDYLMTEKIEEVLLDTYIIK